MRRKVLSAPFGEHRQHSRSLQLVYTAERSDYLKSEEEYRHVADFSYSLGFSVNKDGKLEDVVWDGLAFRNGLTAGATLLAAMAAAIRRNC